MAEVIDAKKLIAKAGKLKGGWSARDQKIRDWYDVIRLKDELVQEGLESVVTTDPKTGFLLGKHLLISSIIAHKVDAEGMTDEEVAATGYMEGYASKQWHREEVRHRQAGRKGFLDRLVSLMLATGYYSVFDMVEKDRIWSEVWSPIQVYPSFGQEGLSEVVNIYSLNPSEANLKAKRMNWNIGKRTFTRTVNLYNWWGYDDAGSIANAIVLGDILVKPLAPDPILNNSKLKNPRLPVFMSPVGGLPDDGAILTGKDWQNNFGESIIATNEKMAKNYDRLMTFSQQLMRDTANPRWLELSSGDENILNEANLWKRGAIFRGQPGDIVQPLPVPPIPLELRTMTFDYQNMSQRGLFPWVMYGNLQMQLSYLAMANVASSAMQVLTPYIKAISGLLTDIDNYRVDLLRANGFKPYGLKLPTGLPEDFSFNVQVDVEIPGYLVQRASVSRMLNPKFRLPESWIIDKMFPEIRDPLRSQAMVRKEDAMSHPKALLVDAIIAYRDLAERYTKARQPDKAKLYEALANSHEAELMGTGQPQPGQQGEQFKPPREVSPGEGENPLEGLGGAV